MKAIGYTLLEFRQVIQSYELNGLDCVAGKEQMLEKVRLIDEQIRQLQLVKQQILEVVTDCPDRCKIAVILAQTLALESRTLSK